MIERLVRLLLLLVVFGFLLLWLLAGISPRQLPSAVGLATGLGAKLACSGEHVSGFEQTRIVDDLASYSVLTRLLHLEPVAGRGVAASLLGSDSAVARYRPGLGCTLQYAGHNALDDVVVPVVQRNPEAFWPLGDAVGAPEPGLASLLTEMLQSDNTAGLETRAYLVLQHGTILAEAYAPGITVDTPLLGWSMGKSITAIMLGRLQTQGRITVNEVDLFPAWADDERSTISLQNMLQMASGLAFSEDYVPGSDATRMLFMAPSASDVAMASTLEHPPGRYFAYSSGTTNLLARLVSERVGGTPQSLVDFIASEISAPLGLQNTTFELDASGVFVGSSFIYAPARDWARFAYLMLNDGKINGQRVLDADWVVRARQPNSSDNEPRYGYQFWLNSGGTDLRWPALPEDAYAMLGNRAQVVMLVPSRQAAIVRLGWTAGEYPTDANFARILAQLPR
jgi:CubicO group peptidase (beta-lactamase class C family)